MKNKNLIFILIQIISLVLPLKIHILREDQEYQTQQKQLILNKDSQFSKVCHNIMNTYHNIGKDSLGLYKLCNEYNLLGSSNDKIKKDDPFCYNNIKDYFCNIKINNRDETDTCEEKPKDCIPKQITQQVLSILKGCVQVILNNIRRIQQQRKRK
jgi:hypothetical protein